MEKEIAFLRGISLKRNPALPAPRSQSAPVAATSAPAAAVLGEVSGTSPQILDQVSAEPPPRSSSIGGIRLHHRDPRTLPDNQHQLQLQYREFAPSIPSFVPSGLGSSEESRPSASLSVDRSSLESKLKPIPSKQKSIPLLPTVRRTRRAALAPQQSGIPVAITSLIPYYHATGMSSIGSTADLQMMADENHMKHSKSYAGYLKESSEDILRCRYSDAVLDDPTLRSSSHSRRSVMRLKGPYVVTFLGYSSKRDLKAELNEEFRQRHAHWMKDSSMTLSKIRGLRARMQKVVARVDLEISTLALAFVYLDLCILRQRTISKQNRKVVGAICLLLAIKFNEPILGNHIVALPVVLQALEDAFECGRKKILESEFQVFADGLQFGLKIEPEHVVSWTQRIRPSHPSPAA